MLEIRLYPDPVLREECRPVAVIDDQIKQLAADMIAAMYAARGVGLAAPQVGETIRLMIVDIDVEKQEPRVFINPVLVKRSKEKATDEEGCLSFPGIMAKVTRPAEVTVEAQDLSGEMQTYACGGLLARALQHEMDHLDGVLFPDKVSPAVKLSLREELRQMEETHARWLAGKKA